MSEDQAVSVNIVTDTPIHTETVTVTTPTQVPQSTVSQSTQTTPVSSVTITNTVTENQSAPVNVVNIKLEELNADIAQLYKQLSDKIAVSVATNHFSFETLDTILAKTVEVIEEYSNMRGGLTGIEKRNIGLSLVKLVLNDLYARGVINQEVYKAMNLTLQYVAPALFYAAKAAWSKLQSINEDIRKNGRKGCFRRNC